MYNNMCLLNILKGALTTVGGRILHSVAHLGCGKRAVVKLHLRLTECHTTVFAAFGCCRCWPDEKDN